MRSYSNKALRDSRSQLSSDFLRLKKLRVWEHFQEPVNWLCRQTHQWQKLKEAAKAWQRGWQGEAVRVKLAQESQELPTTLPRAIATWKDKTISLSNLLGYTTEELQALHHKVAVLGKVFRVHSVLNRSVPSKAGWEVIDWFLQRQVTPRHSKKGPHIKIVHMNYTTPTLL